MDHTTQVIFVKFTTLLFREYKIRKKIGKQFRIYLQNKELFKHTLLHYN